MSDAFFSDVVSGASPWDWEMGNGAFSGDWMMVSYAFGDQGVETPWNVVSFLSEENVVDSLQLCPH